MQTPSLLRRYLQSIENLLPSRQREDIILGPAVISAFNLRWFLPASATGILLFSPTWHTAYEICLARAVLGVVAAAAMVFRPDWYRLRPIARLLSSALLLFCVVLLVQGAPWVALADPTHASANYATSVSTANIVIFWSIVGTIFGIGISVLVDVWCCISLWRQRGQFVSNSAMLCSGRRRIEGDLPTSFPKTQFSRTH